MSNDKLKLTNRILVIVVVLCIAAIIIMLIAWPRQSKDNDLSEDVNVTGNPAIEETLAGTEDSTIDGMEDSTEFLDTIDYSKTIEIETPYCIVNYPAAWSDYLKYEDTGESDVFSQTFYCCIKEQEIEMFSIYFGASVIGAQIGYIEKDGEKIAFSVDIGSFEPDETWTKEETQIFYAMMEGVNDIIDSVMSNESYLAE